MIHNIITLLPDAKIDVFAHDVHTHEEMRVLEKDWRMTRIKMRVDQGDIVTAINRYAHEKSPDIIIVETHAIDDGFTRQLEALANVCTPETAAIFIGPENDIALYRHLIAMGATDYLVRPVQARDLLQVINSALQHKMHMNNSRMIAVMGSKGGVGSSRLSQALAHALTAQDEKATLFDTASAWGIMAGSYGIDPLITLREVTNIARNQEHMMDELRVTITPNLSLLATGGDPLLTSTMNAEGFEGVIDALLRRCPNVIVDLSQSATSIRGLSFARAHHIVLTTMATPLALRNTRLLIKEIQQLRGPDAPIHVVVNQRGILPKEEVQSADIFRAIGIKPIVELAYQPELFARLDTTEGERFIKDIQILTPSFAALVTAITGRSASAADTQNTSLLNRFLKKG